MPNTHTNLILFLLVFCSCYENIEKNENHFFIDSRDGQVYKIKQFGKQIWMTQNLNYKIDSQYQRQVSLDSVFGQLYQWEDACKVCPEGWHLPSDTEWLEFEVFLGLKKDSTKQKYDIKGAALGKKLKYAVAWGEANTGIEIGWNALPSGFIGERNYVLDGKSAYFWTSTPCPSFYPQCAWSRGMYKETSTLYNDCGLTFFGYSVRCIKKLE